MFIIGFYHITVLTSVTKVELQFWEEAYNVQDSLLLSLMVAEGAFNFGSHTLLANNVLIKDVLLLDNNVPSDWVIVAAATVVITDVSEETLVDDAEFCIV